MEKQKFTDNETIRIAQLAWPMILNKLKESVPEKKLRVTPLSISDNNFLDNKRPFASLGGVGCIHHLRGGCTMCAYNIRQTYSKIDNSKYKKYIDQIIKYYVKANKENEKRYFYGFGTGGSFWDPTEIPPTVRRYLYEKLKEITPKEKIGVFTFESRLEFVNKEVINEAREYLGDDFLISLGYGLESSNNVIREACINKRMPEDWLEKLELLKQHQILCRAHIIVKPPFLTEAEAIADAISSVKDIFENKYALSLVVMAMRIHPNTAVGYLHDNNEYSLPNIWSIIEIIKKLGPDLCRQISFNGFAWRPDEHTLDTKKRKEEGFVQGCPECTPELLRHLLNFKEPNSTKQWQELIDAAETIKCSCKDEYLKKNAEPVLFKDLNTRIVSGINKMSKDILGKDISLIVKEIKNL